MTNLVHQHIGGMVKNKIQSMVAVPEDMVFFLHQDNTVSVLIDQRRINRIKLTDRLVYDLLLGTDDAFYCMEYDMGEDEKLTIIRTSVGAIGLNEVDLSQSTHIDIGIGQCMTIDEYCSTRDISNAQSSLIKIIDSLINVGN